MALGGQGEGIGSKEKTKASVVCKKHSVKSGEEELTCCSDLAIRTLLHISVGLNTLFSCH